MPRSPDFISRFLERKFVMDTRLRRILLSLFTVAAFIFAGAFAAGHSSALADGQCGNGHNWDNIKQICV
jgi:hypothetical protein